MLRRWLPSTVLAAALLALPLVDGSPVLLNVGVLTFIYALLGVGWNLIGGYAGQVSFGHAIFFGLGAYAPTLLYLHGQVSPWIGLLVGMAVAVGVGLLIGWPMFRLGGHYFAIATIAAGAVFEVIFSNWQWAGAAAGVQSPILSPSLAHLQWSARLPYYELGLACLALGMGFTAVMERGRLGFYLVAIREDPEAARALGVPVARYKQAAMAGSAALAALAGGLYAQYILFVDPPSTFGLSLSIQAVLVTVLGGAGSLYGPLIGAAVLVPLGELTRQYLSGAGNALDLVIYGLLIMLVAVYRPDGLAGLWSALCTGWRARATRRGRVAA